MKQGSDNKYILTQQEFLVLAALAGLDKIRGVFFDNERKNLSEEDIYYALFELTQRGALDDRWVMREPYKRMFSVVRNASMQIIAYKFEEFGKDTILAYLSHDGCVLNRISRSDEGAVCLYEESHDSCLVELSEEKFLPKSGYANHLSDASIHRPCKADFFWSDQEDDLIRCRERTLIIKSQVILKWVRRNEKIGWIWGVQDGFDCLIRLSGTLDMELFSVDNYMKTIKKDLEVDK